MGARVRAGPGSGHAKAGGETITYNAVQRVEVRQDYCDTMRRCAVERRVNIISAGKSAQYTHSRVGNVNFLAKSASVTYCSISVITLHFGGDLHKQQNIY